METTPKSIRLSAVETKRTGRVELLGFNLILGGPGTGKTELLLAAKEQAAGQLPKRKWVLHVPPEERGDIGRLGLMQTLLSPVTTEVVLVDEVEIGVHHTAMTSLMEAVRDQVSQGGQVLMVTHSMDLIRAAWRVFDACGRLGEMQAIRLEADGERSKVVRIDGERLGRLLEAGYEIR